MGILQEMIQAKTLFTILLIHCGLILSHNLDNDNGNNDLLNTVSKAPNRDTVTASKAPITEKCKTFFDEYSKYAGEFSHCELEYSEPFRICENCVKEYAITSSIYKDLVTDADLDKCRIKYMRSDRVQIIPIMQQNIVDIWTQSACSDCFENITIDHLTKTVNYNLQESVVRFLHLYIDLSVCMNASLESRLIFHPHSEVPLNVCTLCLQNYTDLNNHYNHMSAKLGGNVCMDIVDRMNYTRLMWSNPYNCSCYSSEPAPIIAIALVVASSPLFFYITLRLTGKQKKEKVFKQKRLNATVSVRRGDTAGSFQQTVWRPSHFHDYHSLRRT